MNGVSRTILHLLPRLKRNVNYVLGYTRSNVQTIQMQIKDKEVEETQQLVSEDLRVNCIEADYAQRVRRINRTHLTKHWEDFFNCNFCTVRSRIFFNATTCPLWTSWSPLPVVAEV
jgi:hypothetical protein